MSDLHELMLTEVAAKIQAREVSAAEVTAHTTRAESNGWDGTLRSYATVMADVATRAGGRRRTRRSRAARSRGRCTASPSASRTSA